MIADCPCGAACRVPRILTAKLRCPKCQRVFTAWDLVASKLRAEPKPAYNLERQPDLEDEEDEEVYDDDDD